jgi:hypothetical protein
MNDDILWDEVTEIKCMGEKHTYDLSVLQHHNFICNDVLVHNTHWLIDVSFRAVSQRKKVAFFAAGDMTEHQMIKRIAVRLCRQPLKPQKIMYPIDLEIDEETDKASVTHKVKVFTERLDWRTAWKACEEFKQKQTKTKKSLFKMSCHPNSSLSVNGIKSILQMWEREDWTPDIIVIDYADILNMDYPGLEGRERINETWKQLRALSQSYHCLVLTATQSNAASYSTSLIDLTNFSEDKRKFAHVTGMVGINQTTDERQNGVMRLNWIVLREEEFNVQRCVYTAGNLGIGNPAIKNLFAF